MSVEMQDLCASEAYHARTIRIRPTSLAYSHATGEGLRGHVLHRPTSFTIYASDSHGRSKLTGGDPFSVSVRGPSRVNPILVDKFDGTYEATWMGTVSGTYLVSVLLSGEHIRGSPYAARVIAPGHCPSMCQARACLTFILSLVLLSHSFFAGRALSPPSHPPPTISHPQVLKPTPASFTNTVHATAGLPACFDLDFHDALGRPLVMAPKEPRRTAVTPYKGQAVSWRTLLDALATTEAFAVPVLSHDLDDEEGGGEREGGVFGVGPETQVLDHLPLSAEHTPATYPENRRLVGVAIDRAGKYKLHVVMATPSYSAEVRLKGSPIALTIHPAEAIAATSRCLAMPADLFMRAGKHNSFTVKTYDEFGNACDMGGAEISLEGVAVSCEDALKAGHVVSALNDLGNGEYRVDWTSPKAGVHAVQLLLNGELVSTGCSPHLSLTVEPNDLCVQTSSVSGEALTSAVAGSRSVILIHGKDACGNAVPPLTQYGFGVTLWDKKRKQPVDAHTVGNGEATWGDEGKCDLTLTGGWKGEGVYELAYRCSLASSFDLHLWHTDASGETIELDHSPHALEVQPNAADCRGSTLRLDGAHALIAGEHTSAVIRVGDRFGNPTLPADGELKIVLVGPTGKRDVRARVLSAQEGLYVCEELHDAGQYTLSASIRGEHILGSPIQPVNVRAGPPNGEHCALVTPAPGAAVAHQRTILTVHCRDRYGNKQTQAALEEAVASGDIVVRVDGPARVPYSLTALSGGAVQIAICAQISGDYRLSVWVGGTALQETRLSPCHIRIEPPPFVRSSSSGNLDLRSPPATPRSPTRGPITPPPPPHGTPLIIAPRSPRARSTSPPRATSPPRDRSPPRADSPPGSTPSREASPERRVPHQAHPTSQQLVDPAAPHPSKPPYSPPPRSGTLLYSTSGTYSGRGYMPTSRPREPSSASYTPPPRPNANIGYTSSGIGHVGLGYMPTSPRNGVRNTSPRSWHGLPKEYIEQQTERHDYQALYRASSGSKVGTPRSAGRTRTRTMSARGFHTSPGRSLESQLESQPVKLESQPVTKSDVRFRAWLE